MYYSIQFLLNGPTLPNFNLLKTFHRIHISNHRNLHYTYDIELHYTHTYKHQKQNSFNQTYVQSFAQYSSENVLCNIHILHRNETY